MSGLCMHGKRDAPASADVMMGRVHGALLVAVHGALLVAVLVVR